VTGRGGGVISVHFHVPCSQRSWGNAALADTLWSLPQRSVYLSGVQKHKNRNQCSLQCSVMHVVFTRTRVQYKILRPRRRAVKETKKLPTLTRNTSLAVFSISSYNSRVHLQTSVRVGNTHDPWRSSELNNIRDSFRSLHWHCSTNYSNSRQNWHSRCLLAPVSICATWVL
jgi:hypothetical protein